MFNFVEYLGTREYELHLVFLESNIFKEVPTKTAV